MAGEPLYIHGFSIFFLLMFMHIMVYQKYVEKATPGLLE